MRNPTRRNKNFGTAKQGHGQDNSLVIPYPAVEMKSFYERLKNYKVIVRVINGHEFKFIIESTRENSFHACTIDDIEIIISHIPKVDYGELKLIILRQPTRKEELLNPVWGRLIYSYEFEGDFHPAVILDSIDLERKFKWSKSLGVDCQQELERLKQDGHVILASRRHHEAKYEINNIRATQLYRTLIHEFGHYVHYQNIVLRPLKQLKSRLEGVAVKVGDDDTSKTNILFDKWDELNDEYSRKVTQNEEAYYALPSSEKEAFAHSYAETLKNKLTRENIIPFDRVPNEAGMGLVSEDFVKPKI